MQIPDAVVAACISTPIAAIVAWFVSVRTLKSQRRAELHSSRQQLVMMSIQYPELEDDKFCRSWPVDGQLSEKYQRYDSYCCFVFNFIEDLHRHFKGCQKRIDLFFSVREMVNRHRKWWKAKRNRADNLEGYPDPKFRQFVDSYVEPEA